MRLIAARGSADIQDALSHPYVHAIVNTLLQIEDRKFFKLVAEFFKQHEKESVPTFSQQLEALRGYHQRYPGTDGSFPVPLYVEKLIQTIHNLYGQNERKVRFQRGAILELLTRRLVCPRYLSSECMGNGRFIDGATRYNSDQVDVAALSYSRSQIDGYECKIKTSGIASEDCTNFIALLKAAEEQNYLVHVGVVSFDLDWKVNRQLMHFHATSFISSYGLDSIAKLRNSPF